MKKNVSPVVAAIVVVVALALLISWGWRATGPQHEPITEPIDMGKMMSKDKMAPPTAPGGGSPMAPSSAGAPSGTP